MLATSTLALVFALSASPGPATQQPPDTSDRAQILELETASNQAHLHGDVWLGDR